MLPLYIIELKSNPLGDKGRRIYGKSKNNASKKNTSAGQYSEKRSYDCGVFCVRHSGVKGRCFGQFGAVWGVVCSSGSEKTSCFCTFGNGVRLHTAYAVDGFRYIAVIAAIGGIRWLMSDLKRISSSKILLRLLRFCRYWQRE